MSDPGNIPMNAGALPASVAGNLRDDNNDENRLVTKFAQPPPGQPSYEVSRAKLQMKELMHRAGLERTAEGHVIVRDMTVGRLDNPMNAPGARSVTGNIPTFVEPPGPHSI